ncbi:MAG: hypothetical protein QM831_32995 [Kofleriaceae bacterium]
MKCWLLCLAACATQTTNTLPNWHPAEATGCQIVPVTGGKFRHRGSRLAAKMGEPRHRGIDVATSATVDQELVAELGYTAADKAIEDEDVEFSVCDANRWRVLGRVRTDNDGRARLVLTGTARLPVGLHQLFAAAADHHGAGFIAYVAPPNASTFVTDIDGTLTASENGVVRAVILKADLDDQPGASAALRALATTHQPIYLTARSHAYIEMTRSWLAAHGYPRGPILTAEHFTRPGKAFEHKRRMLAALAAAGITPLIAIGNRASDVRAYAAVPRVFVKLPGYADEVAPLLNEHVTTFTDYKELAGALTRTSAP